MQLKTKTQKSNPLVLGLTTDPYNNIYGYSLVFFRLFDYLDRHANNIRVELISNDGVCSKIVKNKNFHSVSLPQNMNLLLKTVMLTYLYIFKASQYPRDTILISNGELPEVIASLVLRLKFKKVYCVFQDDRVRESTFFSEFVCSFRVLLLRLHKNIIFVNTFTRDRFKGNVNKYYIGNPVF